MRGFWGDALDETLNAGYPIVQQLAAQKLIDKGVIRRPSAAASFGIPPQSLAPQYAPNPQPASVMSNGFDLGGVAIVILILLLIQR